MAVGGILTDWRHGTNGATTTLTDFSTKTMSVETSYENETIDSTTFKATSRSQEPSFTNGEIEAEYKYDTTVYGQLTAIKSGRDTVDFQFCPDGATTGKPKDTGEMFISSLKLGAGVGELLTIEVTWTVTGDVDHGVVA